MLTPNAGYKFSALNKRQRIKAASLAQANGYPNCVGLLFFVDDMENVIGFERDDDRDEDKTDMQRTADALALYAENPGIRDDVEIKHVGEGWRHCSSVDLLNALFCVQCGALLRIKS